MKLAREEQCKDPNRHNPHAACPGTPPRVQDDYSTLWESRHRMAVLIRELALLDLDDLDGVEHEILGNMVGEAQGLMRTEPLAFVCFADTMFGSADEEPDVSGASGTDTGGDVYTCPECRRTWDWEDVEMHNECECGAPMPDMCEEEPADAWGGTNPATAPRCDDFGAHGPGCRCDGGEPVL